VCVFVVAYLCICVCVLWWWALLQGLSSRDSEASSVASSSHANVYTSYKQTPDSIPKSAMSRYVCVRVCVCDLVPMYMPA
jgi:hypothetical protein